MERALFGNTGRLVTADEFYRHAGPDYKARGIFPICQQCREVVDLYGVNSTLVPSRFDHSNFPADADPYDDCPAANRQAARFIGLSPTNLDSQVGSRLKREFFDEANLALAYQFMHRLAGPKNLPFDLLQTIFRRADKRRIWDYVGLPAWCVPFILMTLAQFRDERFGFHFGFQKPPGPADYLWDPDHQCSLAKYFSDSGKVVQGLNNPLTVTEDNFNTVAAHDGKVWVSEGLVKRLKALHGI